MAVDTMLKIAQKCKRRFVQVQHGEARPFIDELCGTLPAIISDLEPHQVSERCALCLMRAACYWLMLLARLTRSCPAKLDCQSTTGRLHRRRTAASHTASCTWQLLVGASCTRAGLLPHPESQNYLPSLSLISPSVRLSLSVWAAGDGLLRGGGAHGERLSRRAVAGSVHCFPDGPAQQDVAAADGAGWRVY